MKLILCRYSLSLNDTDLLCSVVRPVTSWQSLEEDRRVKSWTIAKVGCPAMQLKLLQAKQEETRRAIKEEKEDKKNMSLPSLFLSLHPPSPLLFSPSLLAAVPKWAGGPRQTQHRAERSRGRSEGWRIDHVADVPLSPCVRTDALTPVGGDCGKGVSLSEGVLYSSLFPSSRHHGPLLLQSSGPARRSRTGSSSSHPHLCPSSWSSSCKCDCRRQLPRCNQRAAILAPWTRQEKLF
ncbi:uncharacterized protein LOC130199374 isoform X8 [Pseudoliparis swirei]|uniref:uncharacterized protein LOC130199374 isoform X8 n=1 Tax=Pseudoliparis swirei TaxID=2059687 RepID=UPI0024BE82AF|nr:uncharacterized protein LOC130199374 isoform X8 [Pseudoliparis swirei]